MMHKPLKEEMEITECGNMMTEKCEVCGRHFKNTYGAFGRCSQCRRNKLARCDVCREVFKHAHGASGICPKCQEEFEPDEMEFVDMDGNIHQRKFPRL